jgi:ABC-type amino acid transport substrate-binding protein
VDLWEAIAQQQGWRYRFQPIPTPNAAIEAAATGKVDVAISCLNIIAEWLEKADFSVPYQEDSLAFLSHKTNEGILPLLQSEQKPKETGQKTVATCLRWQSWRNLACRHCPEPPPAPPTWCACTSRTLAA